MICSCCPTAGCAWCRPRCRGCTAGCDQCNHTYRLIDVELHFRDRLDVDEFGRDCELMIGGEVFAASVADDGMSARAVLPADLKGWTGIFGSAE